MRWIVFGARLALRSTRASLIRALVMSGGVALSVMLLLTLVAIPGVLDARDQRVRDRAAVPYDGDVADAPVFVLDSTDMWGTRSIVRRTVALAGVTSPPPGVAELPAPGEAVVSPALADLIEGDPTGRLAMRYPGWDRHPTIAGPGLAGPEEVFAYVGVEPTALAAYAGLGAIRAARGFGSDPSAGTLTADHAGLGNAVDLMLLLTAAMLCVFLSVCVRLSASTQDRRLAALRLAGASSRRARAILAGEVGVAVVVGTAMGSLIWAALSRVPASGEVGGLGWYRPDLAFRASTLVVIVVVPIAALAISQLSARSALSSSFQARRVAAPRLSVWPRLATFASALAILAVLAFPPLRPVTLSPRSLDLLMALAILLVTIGLPLALPVLLRGLSTMRARTARRVSTLLAMRWIAHQPGIATRMVVLVAGTLMMIGGLFSWSAAEAATQNGYLTQTDRVDGSGIMRIDHGRSDLRPALHELDAVEAVAPLSTRTAIRPDGTPAQIIVADCRALAAVLAATGTCDEHNAAVVAVADRPAQRFCSSDGQCTPIGDLAAGTPLTLVTDDNRRVEPLDQTFSWPRNTISAPTSQIVPELGLAAAVVDPDDISPSSGSGVDDTTTLVRTDGSPEADQQIRTAVLTLMPGAEISTVDALYQARNREGAPTRTVIAFGGFTVLAIAALAQIVASLDAAWQRRRTVAILKATGMADRTVAITSGIYASAAVLVACLVGLAVGTLLQLALDRVGHRGTSLSWTLIAAASSVFAVSAVLGSVLSRTTFLGADIARAVRDE